MAQPAVTWVDVQGAPAPHYLEGGRAYVQVEYRDTWLDPGSPDSIGVDLAAQQSGDTEAFSLTETGPDTGVFVTAVQLRSAAAISGDGILQTLQSATPPHEHDTITATLLLPEGTFTASKGLIGSTTTFLDEWGQPATQYAVRTAAYVRVEDQNRNRPGLYDFTTVTLTSAGTGDVETLALVETGKDSGVFEGSIPVRDFVQQNQDGKLDINLSDQIEVRHEDLSGHTESSDTAEVVAILLVLLDEEGRPATAWLDGGTGRARVVNHALGGLDQLTVWLRSLTAGDFQQFHLPLTAPGSGIYEGTFRLATAPVVLTNGRVETASGGDTVEVEDLSSGMKLRVPVIGSRVLFLDAFGRVTDRYVPGDSIRVRVTAPSLNDPLLRDAAPVLLKQGAEQEGIQLLETGFDTGIFEGTIPSVAGTSIPGNGTLEVDFGLDLEAEFPNLNFPDPSTARAQIVGAAIQFVDAQGQPAERFLESSRAYVQVTYRGFGSPTSVDTLSVDIAASLTGDTEFFSLTETGEDTGVFLGSIPLRLGSSTSGDGILQTTESPGPPYELDTLTAGLYVPEGLFTATAGLTGSRTAFVDAYGREVETYPIGSRVHVRVEDQNFNRQGLWDTVRVMLIGQVRGDEEELTLQETTRDSGVYEGSMSTASIADTLPSDRDGVFQVDGGEAIEVTHEDFLNGTESFDRAAIGYAGVFFINEAGEPDAELLEGGIGRVRVFSRESNTNYNADSLTVTVRSRYTGDQETVTLVETGGSTNVFEGSFRLAVGPASSGNQRLETANSGPPAFLGDEVTARYALYEDVAVTVGSRLLFLDAFGRATETYVPGESIRVRVIDPTRNDAFQRDTAYVSLQAAGDQEDVEALETGFDTGVFEAAIPSRAVSFGNSNNDILEATSGAEIEATHFNTNFPEPTVARARMAGGSVLFVDAQGQPATVYLEGARAYVRVVYSHFSPTNVDSLSVDLAAGLSGDTEFLSLTETGSDTGVYVGSIGLRTGAATSGDGVLQTMQDPGPPHEYDTLTARLLVPEGAFTAAIGLTGSRTEFVDAFGRPAETYAVGSQVYVRVEDQNYNRQGLWDTVRVTLRSARSGDQEELILQETGKDAGIFAGSMDLSSSTAGNGDGQLQAQGEEEIEASHEDFFGSTSSTDRARIDYAAVLFIDEAGQPVAEVVEGGIVRVRVFEKHQTNSNPYSTDTVTVALRSRFSGDFEQATLTETGADTNVFEGTFRLAVGGAAPNNSRLETGNSGPPEFRGDVVTAEYALYEAQAVTVGSSLVFLDAFGRETETYVPGETVRVRAFNPALNNPFLRDTAYVSFEAGSDREDLELQENGFDTGVFEGAIPSRAGAVDDHNGILDVTSGAEIVAQHFNANFPEATVARARMAGGAVQFVDAQGQPAAVYLEGSRAHVRVVYSSFSPINVDSLSVDLAAELSGDTEFITLTETGSDTGVYVGSISLRSGASTSGDGLLQTLQSPGPPHEFDTLTARLLVPEGAFTATAGLTGSRTEFLDAFGRSTETYPLGAKVYVRVEDQNSNRQGLWDTVRVTLRATGSGDEEELILQEVNKDAGIFEGSIDAGRGTVAERDGRLQVDAEEAIEATHEDFYGGTSSTDRAFIDFAGILFIDEAGQPESELIEGGTARVRVFSRDANYGSSMVDGLSVTVRSRYTGDQEQVWLGETGPDTSVFEGVFQLGTGPASGGNYRLETANSGPPEFRGDEVTAQYALYEARAVTVGSRLVFLDAFGRETETYVPGETVRVRAINPALNDPFQRDTAYVSFQVGGDQEDVEALETGFDTGVFEGAIPSRAGSADNYNGVLEATSGAEIVATHSNANFPEATVARARFSGASLLFVDAQGQPAAVYLEGSRAYIRMAGPDFNPSAQDTMSVDLSAALSGDTEVVTLTEVSTHPGVYVGSIQLRSGGATSGDGILQTIQSPGPPHEFDTLTARLLMPEGAYTATAGLTGSRTEFIDEFGRSAASYPQGSRIYVRVEDQSSNRQGQWDTVRVTLRGLRFGDEEELILQEINKDAGIFEGSIDTGRRPVGIRDGLLQVDAEEAIEATHEDFYGGTSSTDRALIDFAGILFIDEAGRPESELIEGGTGRVRVFNRDGNFDSSLADGFAVMVRSRYTGDQESVWLEETGADTSVFEGTFQLGTGSASSGNYRLETANSGPPEFRGDVVSAEYAQYRAEAVTLGSRMVFLDAFGRVTETYVPGETLRVRVINPTRNNPFLRDNAYVSLQAGSDQEDLALVETGFDTGVFEGAIPSAPASASSHNGVVEIYFDQNAEVVATHENTNFPEPTVARARIAGISLLFVDAQGRPATVYLEGSRAYLRVFWGGYTGSVLTVDLQAALSGDQETVTLTRSPTEPGVFLGSIQLRSGGATSGDGLLQAIQSPGPPHEFDTLTASMPRPEGIISTSIGLTGSRTDFIDEFGRSAASYPQGSRIYVRVEDQNANRQGLWDTVRVTLRGLRFGDEEELILQEVNKDAGIFEGSIDAGRGTVAFRDGRLQVDAEEAIEATHEDYYGGTSSTDRALIDFAGILFIDEAGRPESQLIDGGTARVRVFSRDDNYNSSSPDGLSVTVRSRYTGDQEQIWLDETGPDTSVFEGTFRLTRGPAEQGNFQLETTTSGPPEFRGDVVTAEYAQYRAEAVTIGSRIVFLDAFGRETTAYALREAVRVRVLNPTRNNPAQRDNTQVQLQSEGGDQEEILAQETGFDTGVFEGSIPSADLPGSANNGTLEAGSGTEIEASAYNTNFPEPTVARARIRSESLLFVDAQGRPATVFLEGGRAYVRLVTWSPSPIALDNQQVDIRAELSGDSEILTVTETGANTGIYIGSIQLRSGSAVAGDGLLQTVQNGGPPQEFDTLVASRLTIDGTVTATIGLTGSRAEFIDAFGRPAETFAYGSRAYVRVEDQNYNRVGLYDTVRVILRGLRWGDDEELILQEVNKDSGIFEGSIQMSTVEPAYRDGLLQAQPEEEIEVTHEDYFGTTSSTDRARIEHAGILFIDEAGQPETELIEGGKAWLRVISREANSNPGSRDVLSVTVRSRYTADLATVGMTETGADTSVFESWFTLGPAGGATGYELETGNSGPPEFRGDEVTAEYGPYRAQAVTIGSRLAFLDAFGRETTSYVPGESIRVRAINPTRNVSPFQRDVTLVPVQAGDDQEEISAQETGDDTGIFEGALPSADRFATDNNGTLEAFFDAEIVATVHNTNFPEPTVAQARMAGATLLFVDAQGQPVQAYLEGTRAYLRVFSGGYNNTITVYVQSALALDSEEVTLTQTSSGPGNRLFLGSIQLRSGAAVPGDGVLQTSRNGGPPLELDTLGAFLPRPEGTLSATAGLIGSRISFVDAEGAAAETYAQGSTAYLQVEDHNFNNPGSVDTVPVTVTGNADSEAVFLTETGPDTGVYQGSLALGIDVPVTPNNGVLQAVAGQSIVATHQDLSGASSTTDQALLTEATLQFVDEAGKATSELLAGGDGWLRVFSRVDNYNPAGVDVLSVDVFSAMSGDVETFGLTETGPDTSVFTSSIPLGPMPPAAFDEQLSTVAGDTVTARFNNIEATAQTVGARISFRNLRGEPVTTYALGSRIRVRVEEPRHGNPAQADIFQVMVTTEGFDSEPVTLTETGLATGIFEGEVASMATPTSGNDGFLTAMEGATVRAQHARNPDPTTYVAQAVFTANQVPQAVEDLAETVEAQPVVIPVLANDSDPDSEPFLVAAVTQGENGTVTNNPDGTVTYTPAAGFVGTDVFLYLVVDAQGGEALGTVTVTVVSANDPPAPVADAATTPEDEWIRIDVLANDGDPNNDPLEVVAITQPSLGGVVINGDQTITYIPEADFFGTGVTFTYTVRDPGGLEASATVTVTVASVNDLPVANADTAQTAEDQTVTINVVANDTDLETSLAQLLITEVTQGTNGTVQLVETDGTVNYTPNANFSGTDTFHYTIRDADGDIASAMVTVTVTGAHDAPVANDDAATVVEDGSVSVTVLSNDTDADNDTLNVTAVTQGANGTVVINPDKSITYTPNANFSGTDAFTYTISDGNGGTDTASVTVTITSVNDAPNAAADAATVAEDGSVAVAVLSNDTDPENDTLNVTAVTQGTNGTVVINPDKSITYTPNANFSGTDAFTYTVSDGNGGTDTALVAVTVTSGNDAPVANDDTTSVDEDGSVSVTVLTNDADPDLDPLAVGAVTQGANGTVVINPDNTITYTPNANFYGTDAFTYTVSDGNGGTDTGAVTVTVSAVNDGPVANDDSASADEDGSVNVTVLLNDTDVDPDTLTVTSVTQGDNGTVVINADDTVTYTPNADFNGTDSFTYTIGDGNGGTATADVTVTVGAGNDAPNAANDSATVAEDGSVVVAVLDNDGDTDQDALTVSAVTQGANGAVAVSGATVTYTPNANFNGSDSFTYTVSDGNGGTDTATVSVTVTAVNDAPVANDDAASSDEDGSVTVAVLANDTDVDLHTLTVTSATQSAHGSVVVNANGTVTYTPAANFNGTDTFSYTVSDGNGGTDTASVVVSVGAGNDAPVANDDTATTAEDNAVAVAVLDNDGDPDLDTLTISAVTQGTKGTVAISGNLVTYTPNANANGADSFTYTVSDGNGGTDTATVSITVTAVNDVPVAVNDTASTVARSAVTFAVLTNDSDVDSASLSVASVTQPANGTVAINTNQTLTFTSAPFFVGTTGFSYTVSDGSGGTATANVTVTVTKPNRTASNLQVLYGFEEGSGTTVNDVSGVGSPLNLTIGNSSAVSWVAGGLSINSATLLQTAGNATKVINAAKASNEITVEAWVLPANLTQSGPARIVTISQNNNKRDVTLGQSGSRIESRLRTSTTGNGGTSVLSPANSLTTNLTHVVFTRSSSGTVTTYIDGVAVSTSTISGNFSNWDTGLKLGIGAELSGGDNWRGQLYLVAVYSRALTANEVALNLLAGHSN